MPWRTKDRMKTVSVALVLCLNIAVDPPDVIRTQPCARLVCWIGARTRTDRARMGLSPSRSTPRARAVQRAADERHVGGWWRSRVARADPHSTPPQKAIESIGKQLQIQYERWQSKARYRQSLDPTHEEVLARATTPARCLRAARRAPMPSRAASAPNLGANRCASCALGCDATPKRSASSSTTSATACRARPQMVRYGCLIGTTRSTYRSPFTTCTRGSARRPSW